MMNFVIYTAHLELLECRRLHWAGRVVRMGRQQMHTEFW